MMKCNRLRGSDIKKFVNRITELYGKCPFTKKDNVELCENDKGQQFLSLNNTPVFILNDDIVPTLNLILNDNEYSLPKVVVDMGAVPFVTKGADVMRPGVVRWDDFKKGDYVLITDEKYGKPLAVGHALIDSSEFEVVKKGKVIKVIHYVGDNIWARRA